eukprot:216955-Heterocapsa_arctica.AAC.1
MPFLVLPMPFPPALALGCVGIWAGVSAVTPSWLVDVVAREVLPVLRDVRVRCWGCRGSHWCGCRGCL